MADATRTGRIQKVNLPEEGSKAPIKVDVLLEGNIKPHKVTIWPSIGPQDARTPNPAARVKEGDYGTFTGYFEDKEAPNGQPYKQYVATNFTSIDPQTTWTPNESSVGEKIHSFDDGGETMVMSYAKDIVCHLIDVGVIKEPPEAQAMWLKWSDDGVQLLRQSRTIPVTREES